MGGRGRYRYADGSQVRVPVGGVDAPPNLRVIYHRSLFRDSDTTDDDNESEDVEEFTGFTGNLEDLESDECEESEEYVLLISTVLYDL